MNSYRTRQTKLFVDYLYRCALLACDEAASSAETLADLPGRWREATPSRANSAPRKIIDGLLDTPLLTPRITEHLRNRGMLGE